MHTLSRLILIVNVLQLELPLPDFFVNISGIVLSDTENEIMRLDGHNSHDRISCNKRCCQNKSTSVVAIHEESHACSFNVDVNVNFACNTISYDNNGCPVRESNDERCPVIGSIGECIIPQQRFCDGTSQCLTDECGCENSNSSDVFWCADGSGCIAFINLCDGSQDCVDGSDECMCGDVVICDNNNNNYCIPRQRYCSRQCTHNTCTTNTVDCTGITNLDDPYYTHL